MATITRLLPSEALHVVEETLRPICESDGTAPRLTALNLRCNAMTGTITFRLAYLVWGDARWERDARTIHAACASGGLEVSTPHWTQDAMGIFDVEYRVEWWLPGATPYGT